MESVDEDNLIPPKVSDRPPSTKPLPTTDPPSTRLWYAGFLGIVVGGLITIKLISGYELSNLAILLIPVAWMPLAILHELGHVIMARLCGWKVDSMVVGFGRALSQFKVHNTKVEIRAIPIEGFVMARPKPGNLRFPKLKLSLIFAAGPGIELLLLFCLYWWVGKDMIHDPNGNMSGIVAQAVSLVIIIGVAIDLVPISPTGGWSDGQGIFRSWLIPREWFIIWSRGEEIDLDAPASDKPRVRTRPT